MTDYTILSKFRNKEQCEFLVKKLVEKGKTCYSFCDTPADPQNPDADPEKQMQAFELTNNFFDDKYFIHVF